MKKRVAPSNKKKSSQLNPLATSRARDGGKRTDSHPFSKKVLRGAEVIDESTGTDATGSNLHETGDLTVNSSEIEIKRMVLSRKLLLRGLILLVVFSSVAGVIWWSATYLFVVEPKNFYIESGKSVFFSFIAKSEFDSTGQKFALTNDMALLPLYVDFPPPRQENRIAPIGDMIFDAYGLITIVRLDNSEYYVQDNSKTDDPGIKFVAPDGRYIPGYYPHSSSELPPYLQKQIVYGSSKPEHIRLRWATISSDSTMPSVRIIGVNTNMFWEINEGCEVAVSYDNTKAPEITGSGSYCPNKMGSTYGGVANSDAFEISMGLSGPTWGKFVVLPTSVRIIRDNTETIDNSGEGQYLVLVSGDQTQPFPLTSERPVEFPEIKATSTDGYIRFKAALAAGSGYYASGVMKTEDLQIQGAKSVAIFESIPGQIVGKGENAISLDENAYVHILQGTNTGFSSSGEGNSIGMSGMTNSIKINDQQIMKSRWDTLSIDMRTAILTIVSTILVSMIGWMIKRLYDAQRN